MTTRVATFAGLAILMACGGQTLEVGSNRTGTLNEGVAGGAGVSSAMAGGGATGCPGQVPYNSPGGGSGPVTVNPLTEWPDTTTCMAGLGELEGTWSGHVLGTSPSFPDFTISLDEGGAAPCGTLTFGDPTTFPPATDPEAGYPPEDPQSSASVWPGFSYTLLGSTMTDGNMRFSISLAEPWGSWCRLQTPYCDEYYGGYFCSDAIGWTEQGDGQCTGTDSHGKSLGAFSCWQAVLCRGGTTGSTSSDLCICDASGCDATQWNAVYFDFRVVGDSANGMVQNAAAYLARN